MKFSDHIAGILGTGSDGWDIYHKAQAMIAAGQPVTDLTIGEHDTGTAAVILEAMHRSALAGHTGYTDVAGVPAMRQAVAERLERMTGVATGPQNVAITAGGQMALFFAHQLVCNPGDRALFIDPYYTTYPGVIRAARAVPCPVLAHAEAGFQPRGADIDAAASGATSLLINTPNNPTGAVYSRQTIGEIADVVLARDLWLLSDEVYDSQVWQGAHISPRSLPQLRSRTLVIGSLSKSHAMTGSRLGWLAGPAEAIEHVHNLATHSSFGVAGYIQDAGIYALGLGADFEAKVSAPFRRRALITERLLAKQSLQCAAAIQGAMYALLDIRATGLSASAFAMQLLENEHIAVLPAESFGKAAAGHVRLAMTVPDAEYEAALVRIFHFVNNFKKDG
ncbi:MAG: aminotransferase class I/II-fold pyridoxal phosphate-dependent enzyme [Rhodobacteraceae bacterium]|nr:aminotransferase class I/II-fold pyridoxal phosphate-dependent enzyme [Paracoccaceae bacterium]